MLAIFWVVAPRNLVVASSIRVMSHYPVDGGSRALWNNGELLPDNTALQPRRQPSLDSPSRKPCSLILHHVVTHFFCWQRTICIVKLVSHRLQFYICFIIILIFTKKNISLTGKNEIRLVRVNYATVSFNWRFGFCCMEVFFKFRVIK